MIKRQINGNNFQMKPQRNQANARERDRTQSVNSAFITLRTLIPTEPQDRKLSKIETLRLACSYISHLGTQLSEDNLNQPCSSNMNHPELSIKDLQNRSQCCTFCLQSFKKQKTTIEELPTISTYNETFFEDSSILQSEYVRFSYSLD